MDGCLRRYFRLMASFLRRLSLRHAVAGGVLGVSGLSASGLAHALRIEEDTKLDFKDVLLRPKRSELSSRAQVCVRTPLKHAAVHLRPAPACGVSRPCNHC